MVQVIDDGVGRTIAAASSNQKDLKEILNGVGSNIVSFDFVSGF